jgi:hypothetical protein
MHRIGKLLLGGLAVLLFLGVTGTGEQGAVSPVLLGVGVVGLGWLAWGVVERRRPATPGGWEPAAAMAFRPAGPRPPLGRTGVAGALGRVEARELTGSAAFGAGLGFSALAIFLFGWVWVGDFGGELPAMFELQPILAHPLAGMVVLAAFRARTRGRRDGVEELYDTCPASSTDRTAGHLLTAWVPVLAALVLAAVMIGLIRIGSPTTFGSVGARQAAAVLGAAVLCVGATALGVGLARWTPWTLAPVIAVVAIGVASVELATTGSRTTEPIRQLSTWLGDPGVDVRLTAPHWIAHHVWIAALVALVTVLALLRDRRRPALLGVGLLAAAVAIGAAVAATRHIDASDARRIASLLTDPAGQPCVDANGLAVCTFAEDADLQQVFAGVANDVSARAPTGALRGWAVRQTAGTDRSVLDPEVRALLGPEPDDDGILPIEISGHPLALEGLRLWVGLAATGTLDGWTRGTTLGVRGQARGVVALWLATRGADPGAQLDLTSLGTPDRAARDGSRPWPDTCAAGPAPVRWAATDVAAARQMVALPEADVRRVVHSEWARLTDRATTTDELLATLGLDPVGVQGDTPAATEC